MNWDKLEGFSIHEWEKEKWDKYLEEKRRQDAIEEGIEQGIELTTKEMIKNGIDIEIISKVTKLSNEEIKKIEESMKD